MQLPDSINNFISTFVKGKSRKSALLTHCRRKLMHQVWRLMLDDKFIHAYQHGIVIHCADSVWRRVYPQIFTLQTIPRSELYLFPFFYIYLKNVRVLLATIRDKGYYLAHAV
jgi:hypothetical protein